jgi:hypothetical protein
MKRKGKGPSKTSPGKDHPRGETFHVGKILSVEVQERSAITDDVEEGKHLGFLDWK